MTKIPVYYTINEEAARQSRQMWSMRDYVKGSETEGYKKQVDRVYLLADKVSEARPEKAETAYNLAERFSKKYAEHINTGFQIELMCPSVMISGAGNFPVNKKEKQNARRDKHMEEYNYIMGIASKIESMMYGEAIIKSSDENAIEQLQEKIFTLTEELERSKNMNKYYRTNKTMKGFEGLTEEEATKLDELIKKTWYQSPAAPFELTSIRNKIKSADGRIKEIQRLKETAKQKPEEAPEVYQNDICEVVENADLMRIQLIFNGKPSTKIIELLKSKGFKWAPSQKAWQRQLTDNARYATKRLINELKAM